MRLFRSPLLLASLFGTLSFLASPSTPAGYQGDRPLDPKTFEGRYVTVDSPGNEISEILIRFDAKTNTLGIEIADARAKIRIGTAFLPPMPNINREPIITQITKKGGCVIREQVSSTDTTRAFSQIGETYKALCVVRTKYTQLEYSIQRGTTPDEVVILWGSEAGVPASRLTLRRLPLPLLRARP